MSGSGPSPTASTTTPTIPFAENATEYKTYLKLQKLVAARAPEQKPRILVFTDIDQDYDDLLAIVFLAEMHRMGAVELAGFVANHHPVEKRAKFLKTVLRLLGLPNVPVAKGTRGVEDFKAHAADLYYGLKNTTFINRAKNAALGEGDALIKRLAEMTGQGGENGKPVTQPLTVLLLSTLQDIGMFFDKHNNSPEFLQTKFDKFVSQGGYEIKDEKGTLAACMGMTNNGFHPAQTKNYTNRLASLNLRSDAWSREAAKAARMPGTFIQSLFPLGPIGKHLQWQWMRQEYKFFWDPLNIPFMEHLNVDWYLNTRLGLTRGSPEFNQMKDSKLTFIGVAPKIKTIAYDCCAAVGAVGDDFMRAMGVLAAEANLPAYNKSTRHNHRVFGDKVDDLGGINPNNLASVMETFLRGSLLATRKAAEAMIPSSSVKHTATKDQLGLVFFDTILPTLKEYRAHQAKAKALAGSAGKAKKEGNNAEYERLVEAASKETDMANEKRAVLLPQVQPMGLKDVPGPNEIPYESMYQVIEKTIQGRRR